MRYRAHYATIRGGMTLWIFATKAERDSWVELDPEFRAALPASSKHVRRFNRSINPKLCFYTPLAESVYYQPRKRA